MKLKLIAVLFLLLFLFLPLSQSTTVKGDVEYTWLFGYREYSLEIQVGEKSGIEENNAHIRLYIPISRYTYYHALPGGYRIASNFTYFQYFVTPDDPYMVKLAYALDNISKKEGFDRLTEANFILRFVQEIPYVDDYTSTGFVDYYKFPLETLIGGGDCEDKSILLFTLLDILGYDAVLFVMNVTYLGTQGHVAVGLHPQNPQGPFSQFLQDYYVYDGKKYYYMESTGHASTVFGGGEISTVDYWVGISPEEAGYGIEDLTVIAVGNWHYSGYHPTKLVREVKNKEGFPWYVVILSITSLIFVPVFILACVREKKKCPRCGYPVEKNFSYCPNCGYWLGYLRPPPPPPL